MEHFFFPTSFLYCPVFLVSQWFWKCAESETLGSGPALSSRWTWGFSNSSVGKESACNAGEASSVPGSGRSTEEGISYPLQYSWASLVAQLVKNPPAKQETWDRSLGWEDPLEKGKATYSSILAWRTPGRRGEHDWVTLTFTSGEPDTC